MWLGGRPSTLLLLSKMKTSRRQRHRLCPPSYSFHKGVVQTKPGGSRDRLSPLFSHMSLSLASATDPHYPGDTNRVQERDVQHVVWPFPGVAVTGASPPGTSACWVGSSKVLGLPVPPPLKMCPFSASSAIFRRHYYSKCRLTAPELSETGSRTAAPLSLPTKSGLGTAPALRELGRLQTPA